MDTSDPALKVVVNSMPAWAGADRVDAEYISGGITNRNYCVRVNGEPFFVRLAGEETEALGINRYNERSALEAAATSGMGPEVVAFLPEQGCLITEWIDGTPVSPEELRQRTTLERVVDSIKAFHGCSKIPGTFSPFRVVELYRESADSRGVEVPEVYRWLLERAREIEEALQRDPAPLHPCHMWDVLFEAGQPYGLVPAGYQAIESMRLEGGFLAWAADITSEVNPYEAGLGFAVKLDKSAPFIGKEALEQVKAEGVPHRLSCLVLADQNTVSLGNEPVRDKTGDVISRVTSGGSGYSVGKSIAFAYLPTRLTEAGTELSVEVFGEDIPAEVVSMPLWDPDHERARG